MPHDCRGHIRKHGYGQPDPGGFWPFKIHITQRSGRGGLYHHKVIKVKDALYYDLKMTKYLTKAEVSALFSLVKSEYRHLKKRGLRRQGRALFAWFLREYCYLPFSLISVCLGYRKSANCRESVVRIHKRFCDRGTWPPNDPETAEVFSIYSSIAEHRYDIDNIPLSDMLLEEDQEHALWCASQVSGYRDKRSSPGCKATPKYSQLELIENAVWQMDHTMDDLYSISEKYYLIPHDS